MRKQTQSLTFTPSVLEDLKKLATKERRSISATLDNLLYEYFKSKEGKRNEDVE